MAQTVDRNLIQTPTRSRRAGMRARWNKYGSWYLFLAPSFLGFLIFNIFTWGFLIYLSFNEWNLVGMRTWVGMDNYVRLTTDPVMGKALKNTIVYVLMYVAPMAAMSLGLALLANRPMRAMNFFRAAYFLPVVTSISVLAIIWSWLLIPRPDAPLNYLLGLVGIPPQGWLISPHLALPSLTGMNVWATMGYYMILWLAGLQSIPESLYDAAKIDGSGNWALFRFVTLPLLKTTTIFIVIISTIQAFQMFGPVYILTGGGPAYSTMTLVYYVWQTAFSRFSLGYAATISIVLFGLILAVALIQRKYLGWGREELY